LANCRRTGRPLSLALVDLDDFKAINDTYGHSVGDNAVIQFSNDLRRNIRASDLAARFGGDEFAMLFPETSRDVVETILGRLETPPIAIAEERGGGLCLRFSWGIATWPQDGETPEPLLQAADHRLYAMKRPPAAAD
jgi:diguanylate cyclase